MGLVFLYQHGLCYFIKHGLGLGKGVIKRLPIAQCGTEKFGQPRLDWAVPQKHVALTFIHRGLCGRAQEAPTRMATGRLSGVPPPACACQAAVRAREGVAVAARADAPRAGRTRENRAGRRLGEKDQARMLEAGEAARRCLPASGARNSTRHRCCPRCRRSSAPPYRWLTATRSSGRHLAGAGLCSSPVAEEYTHKA